MLPSASTSKPSESNLDGMGRRFAVCETEIACLSSCGHGDGVMSTLTIRLPDRLKSKLSAQARASGKTVLRMVREMLDRQLAEAGPPAMASLYDRSRDLCGSVRNTPRDLARNKQHLAGYGAWKR